MIITLEGILAADTRVHGRCEIVEVLQCTCTTFDGRPAVMLTTLRGGMDYVVPAIEFARFIAACNALLLEEVDNGSKIS